ncbi:hypothetical protein [Streptomyces cavernicola]|uniref:SAM-dependent methyltransferase n=1 Tax=Streptomyces cavernicola TaxID=3043613 RepID=A0ABT6S704_9ACTN|nr:hypothetical protein [Streptomyces sp. B-S-A6]MDI3403858.1 hypothetical protein [Streptomyces sp. B-S-A6]
MNMTKTPQPAPPSPASAAPASSTPIYDALVREWYAEGPSADRQRDDAADAA